MKAANKSLTYPRYVWIIYGWNADEWWKANAPEDNNRCSLNDKLRVLERSLIIQHYPVVHDRGQVTASGYVGLMMPCKNTCAEKWKASSKLIYV